MEERIAAIIVDALENDEAITLKFHAGSLFYSDNPAGAEQFKTDRLAIWKDAVKKIREEK